MNMYMECNYLVYITTYGFLYNCRIKICPAQNRAISDEKLKQSQWFIRVAHQQALGLLVMLQHHLVGFATDT